MRKLQGSLSLRGSGGEVIHMTVEIKINDKKFIVPPDVTILEACEMAGYDIPTLCRDREREAPFTSCFICVVDVEGLPRYVPSCGTAVRDGMNVRISGEKVDSTRKLGLELILSDHNADCKPPCHKACPAHADVQGYVNAIANGQYETAVRVLKKRIPLPSVLGRVCPHPCETDCRRNYVDKPVSIRNLKRFVGDWILDHKPYVPPVAPSTGKKVAVVGGGPAGITAAFYLRQDGHAVTIYEQMPALGGMLRYGIPEYRLPKELLDRDIQPILDMGIDVKLNSALGKDVTLKELEEKYDAVFLGIGAWKSKGLRVEGENHPQVLGGIDFLIDVALGNKPKIGQKVLVIGGGNTAVDAARTAVRLGSDVTMVYRRTEEEMPAEAEEIHDAKEEGVQFIFLAGPVGLKFDGERLTGLECTEMCLGEPDESGRRRPVPKECSEFCLDADTIIKAIGQDIDKNVLSSTDIEQTKWGTVLANKPVFQTNHPNVFAGGDLVTGPALVVDALYSGRKAAEAISMFFDGRPFPQAEDLVSTRDGVDEEYFKDEPKKERKEPELLPAEPRAKNFDEVDLGLTEEAAREEAARCMSCGCQDIYECKLKDYMNQYQADPNRFSGMVHDGHDYPKDESHPYLLLEPNKCVKCGRCVEVCDQARGLSVYGFVNRGFDATIRPTLDRPLAETNCISCGDCAAVCPVGAIMEKIPLARPGPFEAIKTRTTCTRCSLGCKTIIHEVDGTLYKITPDEEGWNNIHMCELGRFKYGEINRPDRVKTPLVKKDGKLVETTWEEAYQKCAQHLKRTPRIVLRPNCTNEESYLARQLAKALGGDIFLVVDDHKTCEGLTQVMGNAGSDVTLSDIDKHGMILLYNTDIMENFSVAGVKIRQAAAQGSKVVVVGDKPAYIKEASVFNRTGAEFKSGIGFLDALLATAIREQIVTDQSYGMLKHDEQDLLNELAVMSRGAIEEKFGMHYEELVDVVKALSTKNALLVFGLATKEEARRLALFKILTNARLLVLKSGINSQGIADLGIPRITMDELECMESGNMLIFGEVPPGFKRPKGCEFLAVQNIMEPFEEADVVLPRTVAEENEGTVLTTDRRLCKLNRALHTGELNWKIMSSIAKSMGIPSRFENTEEITQTLINELKFNRLDI